MAVGLLLGGCSRIGLAYNWFFQDILTDYVDRYTDLDQQQYNELDERMARFVDWHRQSELPEYARFLRIIHTDLQSGQLSSERLAQHVDAGEALFDRFVRTLLPKVTPTLSAMSEQQLRYMSQQFSESNQDIDERWAEADLSERVNRIEDRMGRWIGRMEPFQRQVVADFLKRQQPVVEGRLRLRQRWQSAFLDVMGSAASAEQLNAALPTFFLDSGAFADPAYGDARRQREQDWLRFSAEFLSTLTDRQRERLSGKLLRYADEFDKLAAN
jgi:hypothetical protein